MIFEICGTDKQPCDVSEVYKRVYLSTHRTNCQKEYRQKARTAFGVQKDHDNDNCEDRSVEPYNTTLSRIRENMVYRTCLEIRKIILKARVHCTAVLFRANWNNILFACSNVIIST